MQRQRKSKRALGRRRKGRKYFIYSNASIVLLVFAVVFLGYQLIGLVGKRNLSQEKLDTTLAELQRYEKEEADLRERIEDLETEEGRERAIRDRFNVVKDNERVIYIIENEDYEDSPAMSASTVEATESGFWARVWSWLPF